jgi:Zn-dependent peptidase ImmA (M78 family)/transcriptional regulator with XRE-family HTH domain
MHIFDRHMFNPMRFACVRKRNGLSKSQMARLAQVDLRSVSAYEAGKTIPRDGVLQKIADKTNFPMEFFFGDDLEEPNPETVSFRSMRKMTARQRDMAVSQGTIANLVCKYIEEKFDLPKADVPDLSYAPTPEAASETLRQYWKIGNLPIPNLIHLLEQKGVRIFSLSIDAREVDAFSTWQGERPMIYLNTCKTAERSRMDAAHELAHLALHRHAFSRAKDVEAEAKAFASAFLMPKASMIALGVRSPSFQQLIKIKKNWKVAVGALNYRLHSVDMMSEWHYRTNWIEIAKWGSDKEPNGIPRENSQILPKVFSALREEGISRSDVARELRIPRSELEKLMFGLTFTAIDGGGKGQAPRYGANLKLLEKN